MTERPNKTDLDRMTLSRFTLAQIKNAGGQSGRPEDSARMYREEIAVLDKLIERYPSYADTLGELREEWRVELRKVMH